MIHTRSTRVARVLLVVYAVLIFGISVTTLAIGVSMPASAQVQTTNETGGERITSDLLLVEKSYRAGENGQNGTIVLTFEAESPTAVTLYDAGAFRSGGELPSKTIVADGRVEMKMPVTQQGNYVGVTVVAGNTRYAVPHRIEGTDSRMFSGRPTWDDTRTAGLSGFLGGLLVVAGVAWRRVRSDKAEVERVL